MKENRITTHKTITISLEAKKIVDGLPRKFNFSKWVNDKIIEELFQNENN